MRALGAAMRIAGRLVCALFALALLAGLLGGLPWLLVTWIGWPLPDHLLTLEEAATALTTSVDDGRLLNVLAIVAWIVWALFLRDVAVEAIEIAIDVSEARRGRPRQPRSTRDPLRLAATVLIGTVVGAVLLGPLRGAAGTRVPGGVDAAHAATRPPTVAAAALRTSVPAPAVDRATAVGPRGATRPPARTAITTVPTTAPQGGVGTAGTADWARDAPGGTYTVRDGDNLWDIAATHLGDPFRWREIYVLNRHQPQRNGYTLTDPDQIHIGWTLALPASTTAPPPPAASPPPQSSPDSAEDPPSKPDTAVPTTPDQAQETPSATPTEPEGTRRPDDDGVVPAPITPPTSTSPSPSQSAQPPTDADRPDSDAGLPMLGGWIGVPLGAAIAAAAAMVWRQRSRRYNPDPAAKRNEPLEPDLIPLPPVITRVRRGLHQQAPHLLDVPLPHALSIAEFNALPEHERSTRPEPGPSGPDLAGLSDLITARGLGLTGDGAEPAARALLIATLTAGWPVDLDSSSEMVITADALTTLLGTDAVDIGPIPRLTVTATLSEAVGHMEQVILERRRELEEHDVPDIATLQTDRPFAVPMPPVLLLAEAPPPETQPRLSTTTQLGHALQIGTVILGEWPPGDTLRIHADGHPTPATDTTPSAADPPATEPAESRLAVLDIPTTVDLLRVIREAHTGEPTSNPPHEPAAQMPTSFASPQPDPDDTADPTNHDHDPAEQPAPAAHPDPAVATQPTQPTLDSGPGPQTTADSVDETGSRSPDTAANPDLRRLPRPREQRVQIHLFGTPVIHNQHGEPVTGLRTRATELLVYLAAHREGATRTDIMEAFWPDASLNSADQRLNSEATNLRRRIREAAGNTKIQPVTNTGGRYQLNPDVLDIDAWALTDALDHTTAETGQRIAALRTAIQAHTAPLADGSRYDWIGPYREQYRRHGIRSRLALADLITAAEPRAAAELLQAAAELDPYHEDLARRAMHALARIGDADAIRAQFKRLVYALNDIDAEPTEETSELALTLRREAAHPRRRPPRLDREAPDVDGP